jgi:hypothetical protein
MVAVRRRGAVGALHCRFDVIEQPGALTALDNPAGASNTAWPSSWAKVLSASSSLRLSPTGEMDTIAASGIAGSNSQTPKPRLPPFLFVSLVAVFLSLRVWYINRVLTGSLRIGGGWFPVLLKDTHEASLPVIQHCRRPRGFRPDLLRQDGGERSALALEVHILLLGKVVVAGRLVLVPI